MKLIAFLKDDRGSQSAEFALIVLVALGATGLLSTQMGVWFSSIFQKVQDGWRSTSFYQE